jgi:carboxymethylenebutenolidase
MVPSGGHAIEVERYAPSTPGGHPAVLLLYGSGGLHWRGGHVMRRYAESLAERGFEAFVVHYFDASRTWMAGDAAERRYFARWVRAVSDVITYASALPEVDSQRVGVLGVSLGAYLAVGVAADDARVTALVDVSGGLEPFLTPHLARLPRTLILHGDADRVVPVSEAYTLARVMDERHLGYQLHVYPGEGHQLGDAAAADALARSAAFLTPSP